MYVQTNYATAAFGRGDLRFGEGHVFAGRFQYSRNNALNAATLGNNPEPFTNFALSSNGTEWESIRTIGGQLTSVLRPSILNDLRVQHSFEHRRRIPNAPGALIEASSIGTVGDPPLLPYRLR